MFFKKVADFANKNKRSLVAVSAASLAGTGFALQASNEES